MSTVTRLATTPGSSDERTADPAQDEKTLRAMIAAWSRALEARDVDGLTADHASDVLLYDVKPPYRIQGVEACRRMWQQCLPYFPERFRSEHRDVKLTVSGDVAFWHGMHHLVPEGQPDHPAGASWIRVTACYRRVDGRWRIVHKHVSIPFDCATGQVAPISDLDTV